MTVITCASTGQSITLLGEPIGNSGEGKVWKTNRNGYLAKIYHQQKLERVQKLAVMIAHRPKEPNFHLNHISFAWPKSVLKDAQGDCVGFLMPEIKGGKELIDVYNPRQRKTLKLEVDWRFLHTTALNIASIIEAIHISGYVVGDIKPQNILVNDRALPSIIDTDSFQVRNPVNGKVYRCEVGTENFTPPELIGKDFSSIDQTEVHDRFRLAVIIYQLLFGGESPFAGKWIGTGKEPETNDRIRDGLWLYAPNSLIQYLDRIIPLEIVHPEVQRCFLKCFNDGYKNSNLRPTAGDWVKALRLAVNELSVCGKVDSHYYSRTYGKCYWCDRSTKLGTDIFPGFARPKQQPAFAVSTLQPTAFTVEKIIENVPKGGQVYTLQGHSNSVKTVAYSPDGRTIVSGSHDKTIKLWDLATGKEIYTLQGHSSYINSVAFSPDGKTLASGSHDKTIKLWDVSTGGQIRIFQGHSGWVGSVAFSPDGKTLASGSHDKTIKMWDVSTGRQIRTFQGHSGWVGSVAFSPDGKTLASGGCDKSIKLWDVSTGEEIGNIEAHSRWVGSVAFSPDGNTLASGSHDKTIKLWDVSVQEQIGTIQAHQDWVGSVGFSPDGNTLASGGSGDIRVWDVSTAREIYSLKGHSSYVTSVAFSLDGKILASSSDDNTINIWHVALSSNTATSSPIKTIQSNVPQPVASIPHIQPVITQPPATPTSATTSSPIKPTQSQVSQTNQSANSALPNNNSKQTIFPSAIAQNTSLSVNHTSAKNQTINKAVNNTSQKSSTTDPIIPILSILVSSVLRYLIPSSLIWWVLAAFFIIFIIVIIITSIKK